MSRPHTRPGRSAAYRFALAGVLFLVYALPLFWPPGPAQGVTAADAPLLVRLFPGVPMIWVAIRLVALAIAAALMSSDRLPWPLERRPTRVEDVPSAGGALRGLALGFAVAQAILARWAENLPPSGQTAFILALFAPAVLLDSPGIVAKRKTPLPWRSTMPALAVILAWAALRLAWDLNSPRVADAVDGWRGWVDTVHFFERDKNLLTDRLDLDLAGLGPMMLFFQGLPLMHAGLLPLSIRTVQIAQIFWLAVSAAGVGVLTRLVVEPRAVPIAVAVFLFAPYTLFVSLVPGPFLLGPIYATATALCALAVWRRRSEAALAALGALSGLSILYPGMVPVAGVLVAVALWQVRRDWRRLWVGAAAGLASFIAFVAPAIPAILTPDEMQRHFQLHGMVTILEPALLGQTSVETFGVARASQIWRPFDILAGALLEPFANPRTAIRLWGDAILDPLGAALVAVGLATCLRSLRRSAAARWLLTFYLFALCPAFVSPVDRVDIVHAVAIPVPIALLAAAGFAAVRRRIDAGRWRRRGTAVATILVAGGGILLFDIVNPRLLGSSSAGVMVRALAIDDADRALLLDYPRDYFIDVRFLFNGVMTVYAAERPVGFMEYGGGALPASELAEEGLDLFFWSPGLGGDFSVSAAICAQWPQATLYEIWDEAHLSRVLAARVTERGWRPRLPANRWRGWSCDGAPAANL